MPENRLAEHSLAFAQEIQDLLSGTLPGTPRFVSVEHEGRYIVRPKGSSAKDRRIPLLVEGKHLASLSVNLYQDLDRAGKYLKTYKSDFIVYSFLDGNPLLRLEYNASSHTAPVSHWQFHAERGAFTNLLTHSHTAGRVKNPHMLSSLHLPTGGERFRPALEDLVEFLIRDCGIDRVSGWETSLQEGRERWRRRQFATSVRDLQGDAASILQQHGWTVQPPPGGIPEEWVLPYRQW